MHQDGNNSKVVHILASAASFGLISVATTALVMHYLNKKSSNKPSSEHHDLVPHLDRSESGRLCRIERFSHYIARQLGLKDASECPQLCKLAYEYMKRSKGSEENVYEYLSSENEAEALYVKLVEELDKCILGYFAFHWKLAPELVSQVLSENSDQKKFKVFVMAATRKQRFNKITKDLKVTRVFSTLVEELKAIGNVQNGEPKCTDVMIPAAHSERSPVLLLMGGGMGAGKSTVLKDLLKEYGQSQHISGKGSFTSFMSLLRPFWAGAAANAVVVQADEFKEKDVIYKALNSRGNHLDMLHTAELVHQSSTDAASSLLVTALNEGRDVIMDGTLSWEPFVEQTIAMARNVHKNRYRMGVGYKVEKDGTIMEHYWEQMDKEQEQKDRKPYRIEMVGVVCDPFLAVIRGIRRAIQVGRAVRVNSQLKSHKRFANAFPKYCLLVDNARLFCTNALGGTPSLIAWKEKDNNLLVDPDGYKFFNVVSSLNEEAESIYELYEDPDLINQHASVWNEIVLSPSRKAVQQELKSAIQRIEIDAHS